MVGPRQGVPAHGGADRAVGRHDRGDRLGRRRRPLRAAHRPADPLDPYGAEVPDPGDAGWCRRLGVEPGRFICSSGRLVPENNAHLLVAAHRAMRPDWPLVVVGDAPYAEEYIASLKGGAGPESRFPGYVFGDGYRELVHRCGIMCVPDGGGRHAPGDRGGHGGGSRAGGERPPAEPRGGGRRGRRLPADGGADALAAVLDALADDPARREELGRRAAARAAERFAGTPAPRRTCGSATPSPGTPARGSAR